MSVDVRPPLSISGDLIRDLVVVEAAGEMVQHNLSAIEEVNGCALGVAARCYTKSPFATIDEARAFQVTVFEPLAVDLHIHSSELLSVPYGQVRLVDRHGIPLESSGDHS